MPQDLWEILEQTGPQTGQQSLFSKDRARKPQQGVMPTCGDCTLIARAPPIPVPPLKASLEKPTPSWHRDGKPLVASRLTLQVQFIPHLEGSHPPVWSQDSAHHGSWAEQASRVSPVSWVQRNLISLAPGETFAQRGEKFSHVCEKLTRLHFFPTAPHGSALTPGKPRWRGWTFRKYSQLVQSQECSTILLALP